MAASLLRTVGLYAGGLFYGIVLAGLGFVATGAGHGTYVVIGVSSSPFGLTQNIPITNLAAPLLWSVVCVLLSLLAYRVPRALFFATMLAHYAALPLILLGKSTFGDWSYASKMPGFVAMAVAIYAFGQFCIWAVAFRSLRGLEEPFRLGATDIVLTAAAFVVLYAAPSLALFAFFHAGRDKEYDFAVEEPAHSVSVRLKQVFELGNLPKYDEGGGLDYTDSTCVIGKGDAFYWVRPLKHGGELCTWRLADRNVLHEPIPEPKGVVAKHDVLHDFGSPALWISPTGGQVVRWEIGGNCDHGLALRDGANGAFRTERVSICLSNSKAIQSPSGAWYLLAWRGNYPQGFLVSVYEVSDNLTLTLKGEHHSLGHHDIGVLDAAFTPDDRLHLVWADVERGIARDVRQNWLRLRAIDLDVSTGAWSNEREVWRLDRSVGSVSPRLHIRENGSTHYVWKVDEGAHQSPAGGIFYQGMEGQTTIKVAESREALKSLAIGEDIVVCFTHEDDPEKVYFRVLRDGKPGPYTSITLTRRPSHALWSNSIVLGARSDGTFWFVDTHAAGTLYNLEVAEQK
jgi:hypothetical protein